MHYFIMKIPNKRELQQKSSDIDFTAKVYYFLVIDPTLPTDNLLERI